MAKFPCGMLSGGRACFAGQPSHSLPTGVLAPPALFSRSCSLRWELEPVALLSLPADLGETLQKFISVALFGDRKLQTLAHAFDDIDIVLGCRRRLILMAVL